MPSWKRGMKSLKHYTATLLAQEKHFFIKQYDSESLYSLAINVATSNLDKQNVALFLKQCSK